LYESRNFGIKSHTVIEKLHSVRWSIFEPPGSHTLISLSNGLYVNAANDLPCTLSEYFVPVIKIYNITGVAKVHKQFGFSCRFYGRPAYDRTSLFPNTSHT